MSKKYYTFFPGEVPSIYDREGKTKEEIIKSENTFMCLVTLKRMKEKLIEYLEQNNIDYTRLIIAPSFDFFLSEEDVINEVDGTEAIDETVEDDTEEVVKDENIENADTKESVKEDTQELSENE